MEKAKIYAKLSKELEWGIAEDPQSNANGMWAIITDVCEDDEFGRQLGFELQNMQGRYDSIGLNKIRVTLLTQEFDVRDGLLVHDVWGVVLETGNRELADKIVDLIRNDFAAHVEKSFILTWDMPREVWEVIHSQARYAIEHGPSWRYMMSREEEDEFGRIEAAYFDKYEALPY